MRDYIITTDNQCDLPEAYRLKHGIEQVYLSFLINDVTYDYEERTMSTEEFYDAMKNGAMPVTQQVNPENAKRFFKKQLHKGKDIIHIAFSSGLSGTYNSTYLGAQEVMEEYPDIKITVIDSLCASMGQGLLVHEAIKGMNMGLTYDELIAWIEFNKLRLIHEVLADDLFHLQRGGRVSMASALIGSALGVKPIIHVNNEGKLIPFTKKRHKMMAIKYLASNLAEKIKISDNLNTVAISHSDCLGDAEKLAAIIKSTTPITDIIISDIGPTVGAHTGIGTIALFYFGDTRNV